MYVESDFERANAGGTRSPAAERAGRDKIRRGITSSPRVIGITLDRAQRCANIQQVTLCISQVGGGREIRRRDLGPGERISFRRRNRAMRGYTRARRQMDRACMSDPLPADPFRRFIPSLTPSDVSRAREAIIITRFARLKEGRLSPVRSLTRALA